MKRAILVCVLLAASFLAAPAVARADGGPLGVGLIIGDPTGVTAEYRLGKNTAIDAALGLDEFDNDVLYIHADFLFILPDLLKGGSVGLSPYVGVGGFLVEVGDELGLGARAPLGLSLDFRTAPIQIFLEIAAFILLVPDTHSDLGGALGARYYF